MVLSAAAAAAFSLGAPLSRLAAPVSAAEVTLWRLGLATLVAYGLARASGVSLAHIRERRTAVLGATLYAHFLLFTLAAQTTTTAHTLALVYGSPALVALGSALILREPPRPMQIVGVMGAVAGIAILVGFEPAASGATLGGDLAAAGSGAALAAYVLAGRYYRGAMPLPAYVFAVYGWAALLALPFAAFSFDPASYDGGRILVLVILGVVPLGMGHTLLNAALRRARATIPNVITTQEATGGVILGALLYGEIPGPSAVLGALLALAGVITVVVFGRSKPETASGA
ncbi:MAG: DMT family transporter [Chloroflexota bacterium]|nr:DMT family transporter [Chloroflexota bacterium]